VPKERLDTQQRSQPWVRELIRSRLWVRGVPAAVANPLSLGRLRTELITVERRTRRACGHAKSSADENSFSLPNIYRLAERLKIRDRYAIFLKEPSDNLNVFVFHPAIDRIAWVAARCDGSGLQAAGEFGKFSVQA
jgi:hypothetical protein